MVAARKVDPRGTRFRALSYEEQATLLEQEIQRVGRHPEATIETYEFTETHQGSPVQIRFFPKDQTT
jgi:hypothetical protein